MLLNRNNLKNLSDSEKNLVIQWAQAKNGGRANLLKMLLPSGMSMIMVLTYHFVKKFADESQDQSVLNLVELMYWTNWALIGLSIVILIVGLRNIYIANFESKKYSDKLCALNLSPHNLTSDDVFYALILPKAIEQGIVLEE